MTKVGTTGELSAEVGASGRRALRDLRLLSAVGMVTLIGCGTALLTIPRPGTEHERLEAAAEELATLDAHDAEGALSLYEWLSHPDLLGPEAAQAGTAALAAQTKSAATWQRFVATSADLPGEAELRTAYEHMVADTNAWGERITTEGQLARLMTDPAARSDLVASSMDQRERIETLHALRELYAAELADASRDQRDAALDLRLAATIAVFGSLGILVLGFLLLERGGRRRARTLVEVQTILESESARSRLEGELNRALDLCRDEASAYRILEAALDRAVPGVGGELLVADSSVAHLAEVARTGDCAACQVTTPADCPAVHRGHTQEFPSSTALDACPNLRARGDDHHTTCVPFTVGGATVGVVHLCSPAALPEPVITQVELIVRRTGERVGVSREFARSQDQAHTDPLTGLLNRRSLQERARGVVESGRQYAVVFADLDHFKTLNDVHGHDAGDRALRLFSRCVRDAIRPADAAARYGGEEFVLVLPDCDADGAAAVITRIREAVDHSLHAGTVPPFTSSFGVAEAAGVALADVIARADAALLAAKRAGRNRSVVWTPELGDGRAELETVASMIDDGTMVDQPATS